MKALWIAAVICGAASGALAQASRLDGQWGIADIPECLSVDGLRSTCPALTISNGQFVAEGSECAMSVVGTVPGLDSATVNQFSCRGEGDTWTFHAVLHLAEDGRLTVLDDYGPTVYLPLEGAASQPAPTK